MVRKIVSLMILLVGASAFGQGSPGVIAPIYTKTGDTLVILATSGDSIMMYDSSAATVVRLRGTNSYWVIPGDTLITTILKASDVVVSPSIQIGQGGGGGSLVFDNFASSAVVYSLTGDGMQVVSGYLSAVLGSTVEGSEITNQTIKKVDIDTTIAMVYASIYRGTSAIADSQYVTRGYDSTHLAGYPIVGSPAAGNGLFFDAGLSSFTYQSGGSGGSGDNVRIDQTLDNSDYVVGATTYTGGFWDVSTFTMRGDTGLNIVKSGSHPGDTAIFRPDWSRIQRNDGTQSIRTFRTTTGDTLLVMQDSSIYTKMTTSNSGGWKFEAPVHIDNNLVFDNTSRVISGPYAIQGKDDAQPLYITDSSGLYLETGHTNKPIVFGSSSNWTLHADLLYGTGNGLISGIKRVIADTTVPTRIRQVAGSTFIVTSTDTTLEIVRDTTNDTTKLTALGALSLEASAGRYYLGDSGNIAGKVWLENSAGTNGTLDSAQHVQADTLIGKAAAKLLGSTSGSVTLKATATAGSTVYTLPTDGTSGQALVTNGSGVLSWSSAGGGGNGSADFDSTSSLDSNILKGAGGTILLDIHKSATPNVVIGKGTGMSALVIGGNNSGVTAVDTALLIYNGVDFGNGYGDYARLDSQRVVNAIRLKRYYFTASDFYWSPEKANAADKMFLTWNMCDTSATWPNNEYKSTLFALADSAGDSHRPLNITWNASERDSLFSFHWKYMSDSGAAVSGSTDTSKMMYPNYALLYVNQTQVDSVFIGKTYSSATADSINFTDRAIAAGDVVTVMIWFETQVSSALKRVKCDWAYLNMRRY